MKDSLRILVVDDEPDIRDFIVLILGAEFPCLFWEAGSGRQAIESLAQNQIDLVICDFNMPNGNGKDVFEHTRRMAKIPKFMLVTSDEEKVHRDITLQVGCGYLEKPYECHLLIQMVATLLDIVPLEESKGKFAAVAVATLKLEESLPFDLYLKLGNNHYVKYFNAQKQPTDFERDRLRNLNTHDIFIRIEDYDKFIADSQRKVFQSITLPKNGLDHHFELKAVNGDLQNLGLSQVLDKKEVVESTQKVLKTVFALSGKIRTFKGLLDWVDSCELSSKKLHSILLTLFCNIILKNLKVRSYEFQSYLILGYVAVLHDFQLDDFIVRNEHRILKGIKIKSQIYKNEQEIILRHVSQVMPLIDSWSHCPHEVIKVIEQHHEKADGTGFPKKLRGDSITDLSAIFNVAHDVADLVWDREGTEELEPYLNQLANDYKGYPHFEEPFEILKSELIAR
jgi:response regulator RpfG family c-di-GMP phosphodiesterase